MSIQNQSILDVANTTFFAKCEEVFAPGSQPPGVYDKYTEVVPTSSKINEIDILEASPVVREWIGSKIFQSIRASSLSATIKKWEKSFEIDRLDLQADKLGMIANRIKNGVSDGAGMYDKIAFDAFIANPTCYDGVALFSASHPRGYGGSTWSNFSSTAFSFAQHDAVMQAGASLADENSEPLRIAYDTLIVGPKLAKIAKEVTQSTERIAAVANDGLEAGTRVAASTIPNVYGGGDITLIIDPRYVGTYDDYYTYVDSSRGPKPMMMFEFRAPEGIALDANRMDGDTRFHLDKYRWSVECDVVCAPCSPHVAFGGRL